MIKRHYPEVFEKDAAWLPRARALAAKTHELMSFLVNVRGVNGGDGAVRARGLLSRFLFLAAARWA